MCKEWAGAQVNKREATGMREKTRDGGREGKACMCAKVARESMLPIMRMRGDGGDANPGDFVT